MFFRSGCRNVKDGEKEAEKLRKEVSTGRVEVLELDLKSLKSVNRFAASFNERHEYLNLLVNNGKKEEAPYFVADFTWTLNFRRLKYFRYMILQCHHFSY